ncbi:MAG TPA: hypothetical protein VM735_06390 [Candidatus Kapabacteria bacterium]|nr:hypothetical protein [Candidatus Kapabacteria bacterium]
MSSVSAAGRARVCWIFVSQLEFANVSSCFGGGYEWLLIVDRITQREPLEGRFKPRKRSHGPSAHGRNHSQGSDAPLRVARVKQCKSFDVWESKLLEHPNQLTEFLWTKITAHISEIQKRSPNAAASAGRAKLIENSPALIQVDVALGTDANEFTSPNKLNLKRHFYLRLSCVSFSIFRRETCRSPKLFQRVYLTRWRMSMGLSPFFSIGRVS